MEKKSKVVNVRSVLGRKESVLNLLQKCSIGTRFGTVNGFSNYFVTVRVAGYQKLAMCKRYCWIIFEQIVTVAFFKKAATGAVL